jgi:hypothetical protein
MMSNRVRLRRAAKLSAAALILGIVGLHFVATAAYLMPDNPLRRSVPSLTTYVDTFFTQNWHLFSPSPATDSVTLWVRCTTSEGATTGWIDPLDATVRHAHDSPLGPHQRLAFIYSAVISIYAGDFAKHYSGDCREPSLETGESLTEARHRCVHAKLQGTNAAEAVTRLATDSCRNAQGVAPASFDMRLVHAVPVPWAERDQIASRFRQPTEYFDLGSVEAR